MMFFVIVIKIDGTVDIGKRILILIILMLSILDETKNFGTFQILIRFNWKHLKMCNIFSRYIWREHYLGFVLLIKVMFGEDT